MSVWFIYQTIISPTEEWWMGGIVGFLIMIGQWGLAIAGLIFISRKVQERMVDEDFDPNSTIDEDIVREEEGGPVEEVFIKELPVEHGEVPT